VIRIDAAYACHKVGGPNLFIEIATRGIVDHDPATHAADLPIERRRQRRAVSTGCHNYAHPGRVWEASKHEREYPVGGCRPVEIVNDHDRTAFYP